MLPASSPSFPMVNRLDRRGMQSQVLAPAEALSKTPEHVKINLKATFSPEKSAQGKKKPTCLLKQAVALSGVSYLWILEVGEAEPAPVEVARQVLVPSC